MRRESFVVGYDLKLRATVNWYVFSFKDSIFEIKESIQWGGTWEFSTISHISPRFLRFMHVSHRL
jgi:hypothetical protein